MMDKDLQLEIDIAKAVLERLSEVIEGSEQTVKLPCSFGDRLWWCYDNEDDQPTVEQSDLVKGFLVEPGGKVSATFDFVCYDEVGSPELFATEAEARAEQVRRLKELQKRGSKNEP